jgi:hypothetical protein
MRPFKASIFADPPERTQASHPWLPEPNSYRHVRLAISPSLLIYACVPVLPSSTLIYSKQ